MGWTKQRLVNQAFGAFGLQGFAFSLTPEMKENAAGILDAMMAQWGTEYGIRIGYNNGANDDTAPVLAQDSGIPDHAVEAVYLGLADRLTDTIGKTLSIRMNLRRADAFDALLSWCQANNIPEMQYRRNTPLGSGNKSYGGMGQVFIPPPVDRLNTGSGDAYINGNDGTPLTVTGGDDQ